MSSSSEYEFQDDARLASNDDVSSSSAYASDASSGDRSDGEDEEDAVFISTRSEMVISPRKKLHSSAWRQIEKRLRRHHSAAERAGVAAVVQQRMRTSSSSPRRRRRSATSATKHRDEDGGEIHARAAMDASEDEDKEEDRASREEDREHQKNGIAGNGVSHVQSRAQTRAQRKQCDVNDVEYSDDGSSSGGEDVHESTWGHASKPRPTPISTTQKAKPTALTPPAAPAYPNKVSRDNTSNKSDSSPTRGNAAEVAVTVTRRSSSSSASSTSPRTKHKPTSFLSDDTQNGAMDDDRTLLSAVAPALLPSPKEEMEELKQTLKKLASQDAAEPLKALPLPMDPTASPYEYLRVAHKMTATSDQARLGEFVSRPFHGKLDGMLANGNGKGKNATRHASFDPAALHAQLRGKERDARTASRSKSMMSHNVPNSSIRDDNSNNTTSLHKKLFANNPPFPPSSSSLKNAALHGAANSSLLGMGSAAGGGAVSSNAQGSRAVLSALKALQDKIRRLEEERETLLQQLSDVKVNARKREAEFASSEKKSTYELGQTKESARAAYDVLRCEKEELNVQLVKSDERKRALETEITHFQSLLTSYSTKADDLQTQLEISESQRTRLQTELDHVKASYKSEVQDLKRELQSLQQQHEDSQEQIQRLDAQFQRESSNHAETRQTVTAMSHVNEKLVAKIPFLLGTSSSPSFSILGNVQDAIRQCDTTYVTPNTLPIEIPTSRPKAKAQKKSRTPKSAATARTTRTRSASILGTSDNPTTTLLSERVRGNQASGPDEMPPGGTSRKRSKPGAIQVPPPPPPPPVSAYINPMQTQILDDLAVALDCAEREFATLNTRYKDTVVQLESTRSGTNGDGNSNRSAAQLSSALGPLLDDLEAKGKQVNLLKQVLQQASNSSINPLRRIVHSPEAIRRKTASLRLLNEYRQLEREAKSPRASTGAPCYDHHQRSTSFFH
uniref:Cep57 centrosome localisation domain-containing protein n=1 Tax=Globisporangium ultimum (strain ATCC 200006 / CBS 805.95 / DAOM BR144) TaxID=431595 RepID=K3WEF1_GLOUD